MPPASLPDRDLACSMPLFSSVPFVMVNAIVTFVCRCPNSEGEDNAENEQLDRDINWNRNISAIPLRQFCRSHGLAHSRPCNPT